MNKELTLSSKKCYNISKKHYLTETILPVYFVSNDKRTKQTTNNRRRRESHTLWWNLSNTAVLQKTANQETFAKEINLSPTFRSLSSNGLNYGHYLCHNCWHQPVEQDKDLTTERCVSENTWAQKLSVRKQPAEVSETFRFKDHSWSQQNSRPVAVENVLSSSATDKYFIRPRFNSSNCLWQINRGSQSWLQSWQKRQKVLSPLSLFRVLHQRLLAWDLETRGCLYCCRRSGISKGMSPESSALYLPYQSARRFRIFRPQIHRTFRRKEHRLCARSQTDRRHKEKALRLALSPIQERLVSRQIPVHTYEMEESASLYCDSQETSKQATRTTNFVYSGTVLLSSIRYQPAIRGPQHLVFLQRSRGYRNSYQRTKTRFLFNQDTNEQLFGKSNVFFFTSSCLQYRQLVQTPLFTGTIKKCNFGYDPDGYFNISSKTHKIWQQECAQTSGRSISFQSTIELYNPENRKVKDQLIFVGLLNYPIPIPSHCCENYAFSRFY